MVTKPTTFKADAASTLTAEATANIKAKQDFASKHTLNRVELTDEELVIRGSKFDQLLRDNTLTTEEKEVELNAIGYYTFGNGVDNSQPDTKSGANVYMNKVGIVYNSNNDTWTLSANGYWKSPDDWDTVDVFPWTYDKRSAIGSWDTVGILLQRLTGDTSGLRLISGYGRMENDRWNTQNNTRSGAVSNSLNGASFETDDYQVVSESSIFNYKVRYVGHNFMTSVTYSSEFANISGNALFFYAHTWEDVKLNSVSVGSDSVGFGWSGTSGRWNALSNDKLF